MKNRTYYQLLLYLSGISFLLFSLLHFIDISFSSGFFLISGFIILAIAVRGFKNFKGLSYSLMILTAVTVSMYYPQHFLSIGSFQFKSLIVPLLQIIMFGMGSQMSLKDFGGVIKMPKSVIIGILCQFTIMPIAAVSIASLFDFPPEIAAGIVLVGSSPSGMASNVMSFIAKANLALSVTLTAFATLLSPLLTPALMRTFANQYIEVDFWSMTLGIFNMVILPICAGLIFNLFVKDGKKLRNSLIELIAYFSLILLKYFIAHQIKEPGSASLPGNILLNLTVFMILPVIGAYSFKILAKGNRVLLNNLLSFLSMAGIGIIITIITAAGRDSLIDVGFLLILACLLHNLFGYSLGYGISRLLGLSKQDCRTVALEVGMQNGGLASGLALQMGKVATVGLAPAIFGPMMNITGSSLANWWRGKVTETSKQN